MQLLSHAFAKAAMFMAAGLIAESLGHDRIADLGGIGRAMPITVLAFGLGGTVADGTAAERRLRGEMAAAQGNGRKRAMVVGAGDAGGRAARRRLHLSACSPRRLADGEPVVLKAPVQRCREVVALALALCCRAARLRAAGFLRLAADRPLGDNRWPPMSTHWPRLARRGAGNAARACWRPACRERLRRHVLALLWLAPLPALAAALLALGGAPLAFELPALRVSLFLDAPGAMLLARCGAAVDRREHLSPRRDAGQAGCRTVRGLLAADADRQSRRLHRRRPAHVLSRLRARQHPGLTG